MKFLKQMNEGLESRYVPVRKINIPFKESIQNRPNKRIKEKLTQAQYNEGQIFVDDFGNEYKFITRQRWEDDERYYAFKPLSSEGIAKSKEFASDWKNDKGPYAWWNGDTLWLDSGNSLLTLKESLKKKSGKRLKESVSDYFDDSKYVSQVRFDFGHNGDYDPDLISTEIQKIMDKLNLEFYGYVDFENVTDSYNESLKKKSNNSTRRR